MKGPFLLLICGFLIGCAPMAVLRAPKPLEESQTRVSAGLSYGINFAPILTCSPNNPGCFERSYLPMPSVFNVALQRGLGGNSELVISLEVGPVPGFRLGYKQLWLDQPILLAGDMGGSLYASGGFFDLGVLGSWPQNDSEPYFAVRGFYTYVWGDWSALIGGITIGERIPFGSSDLFLELTLYTSLFSNAPPSNAPKEWVITPSIGFRW